MEIISYSSFKKLKECRLQYKMHCNKEPQDFNRRFFLENELIMATLKCCFENLKYFQTHNTKNYLLLNTTETVTELYRETFLKYKNNVKVSLNPNETWDMIYNECLKLVFNLINFLISKDWLNLKKAKFDFTITDYLHAFKINEDFSLFGKTDLLIHEQDKISVIDIKLSNTERFIDLHQLYIYALLIKHQLVTYTLQNKSVKMPQIYWGYYLPKLSLFKEELFTLDMQHNIIDVIQFNIQYIKENDFRPNSSYKTCILCPYKNTCNECFDFASFTDPFYTEDVLKNMV